MSNLIRKELRRIYFELPTRYLREEIKSRGSWRQDASMARADTRQHPARVINRRLASEFLNKELIVYFETPSVDGAKIFRYIYREWLRLYDGRPPFQRESFFAKAVQISKNTSQKLAQLSAFHRTICQRLSVHSNDLVDFYPPPRSKRPPRLLTEPVPSTEIQSWRDSGYIMRHLFRALYIVVDSQTRVEPPGPTPVELYGEDRSLYLEFLEARRLSYWTVLLVKTGDETHLHSPISFLPLFDAGLALDVNRGDYHSKGEETVVRVTLGVAVRFVWELLCKEEEALVEIGQLAEGLRQEQDTFCNAWVENVISHSDRIGIDKSGYTWLAVRRALARMHGEAFEEEQVTPWSERIRWW
ncbi:hypothetical protein AK830_g9 [Neonectria ditissima]|uniref:Uncharacterized protein n=1 Tax=Neonectria ditissima TaxID=78410 RepID=A0A0P7BM47_9HYPO|nr:hypothetical protein AK830_g9 [Neonectria ditissima]